MNNIIWLHVDVSIIAGWVAHSANLDQMPHSAASGLGIHCLHRSVWYLELLHYVKW